MELESKLIGVEAEWHLEKELRCSAVELELTVECRIGVSWSNIMNNTSLCLMHGV